VVEYWHGDRWQLTDPQIRRRDLTSDDFQDGPSAWDQPHDELDTSLDLLSRLAATAESVERIKKCFDLYPELQPPADAVAR
jgi:hypothetical protein